MAAWRRAVVIFVWSLFRCQADLALRVAALEAQLGICACATARARDRDILGKLHTHAPRELTPAAWAAANSQALAPDGPAACPPASAQLSPELATV